MERWQFALVMVFFAGLALMGMAQPLTAPDGITDDLAAVEAWLGMARWVAVVVGGVMGVVMGVGAMRPTALRPEAAVSRFMRFALGSGLVGGMVGLALVALSVFVVPIAGAGTDTLKLFIVAKVPMEVGGLAGLCSGLVFMGLTRARPHMAQYEIIRPFSLR